MLQIFYFSVVVLSHIVIATHLEASSGNPFASTQSKDQDDERYHDQHSASEDGKLPPESVPPDPMDDKGSGDVVNSDPNQSAADGKYALALTDNAVSRNTSDGHLEGNFSEAFNLKHLIYFENSSQNDG